MKITDEKYIEVYEKFGHNYWLRCSDEQLKVLGNSDEKIKQIKIDSVKNRLSFSRDGIEIYKALNQILGGENRL